MQLELNARTYLFLAACIALGLFIEALKFWPTNQPLGSADEFIQLSQPYSVSERTIRTTTKMLAPSPHLQAAPPVNLPELNLKDQIAKWQTEQDKLKAEEEKKKKAAKNWHWVWNKKLQRWEWKKKTKKKPKDAAAKQADSSADSQTTDTPASQVTAPAPQAVTGPTTFNNEAGTLPNFGVPNSSKSPQKFLSAQEWIDYLENSPSQSKTDNFIQQYRQHLVSNSVFYQVVGSMLKSNKVNVEQQGIYALGKTPSLESFTLLAGEYNSLQTSSPLYQATNADLQAYGSIANLSVLQQVLGGSSQSQGVTQVALTELQNSIQTNLGSANSSNASHYTPFVPELTKIASSNSTLSSQAQQILSQLAASGIH